MTSLPFYARLVRLVFYPKSLRLQLLTRTMYVVFALLLIVGVLQYVFLSGFLYRNTVSNVVNEIHSIPPQSFHVEDHADDPSHPDPDSHGFPGQIGDFSTPVTSLAIIHENFQMTKLSTFTNHGPITQLPNDEYQEALQSPSVTWRVVTDAKKDRELVILVPISTHPGKILIQASTPLSELTSVMRRELAIYTVLAVFALLMAIIILFPSLRGTLRPLSKLVDTVRSVDAGNLDVQFHPERAQEEVQVLSASFNAMLKRLHEAFEIERETNEKMRQFVADASHELRTPLTSIHGFLEVLRRGAADNPQQLKQSLNSMYLESERMTKLVNDLVFLARLDGTPQFDFEQANLAKHIEELEQHFIVIAGHRHVEFDVDKHAVATYDKDRVKQVLFNLFSNAVHHTDPENGQIKVTVTTNVDGATISIRDNGTGIPAEHIAHLFDRFYRVDTARSRKDGGVGLGLAITKSIVDKHHGTITCESELGQGTTFHVWLPT